MDTDLLGKFLKSASQRKAGGDDTNESIPMDVEALNEQLSQLSTEQLQALAQMTGSGDLKSSLGTSQDTDPTFRSFIPEPGQCKNAKKQNDALSKSLHRNLKCFQDSASKQRAPRTKKFSSICVNLSR